MRDFANSRSPSEAEIVPFLHSIGGYATLFGLVVAIEDGMHQQLLRRVMARLFDPTTPGGRQRLCSDEVGAYLRAGLQEGQLKHVRMLALQQTHLFVLHEQGVDKLVSGGHKQNNELSVFVYYRVCSMYVLIASVLCSFLFFVAAA
jgi:hypothetical protein